MWTQNAIILIMGTPEKGPLILWQLQVNLIMFGACGKRPFSKEFKGLAEANSKQKSQALSTSECCTKLIGRNQYRKALRITPTNGRMLRIKIALQE